MDENDLPKEYWERLKLRREARQMGEQARQGQKAQAWIDGYNREIQESREREKYQAALPGKMRKVRLEALGCLALIVIFALACAAYYYFAR